MSDFRQHTYQKAVDMQLFTWRYQMSVGFLIKSTWKRAFCHLGSFFERFQATCCTFSQPPQAAENLKQHCVLHLIHKMCNSRESLSVIRTGSYYAGRLSTRGLTDFCGLSLCGKSHKLASLLFRLAKQVTASGQIRNAKWCFACLGHGASPQEAWRL